MARIPVYRQKSFRKRMMRKLFKDFEVPASEALTSNFMHEDGALMIQLNNEALRKYGFNVPDYVEYYMRICPRS